MNMRSTVLALAIAGLFAAAGCLGPGEDHRDGDDHGGDGHHGDAHHDDGHHGLDGEEGDGSLPMTGAEDVMVDVTAGEPAEFRFTPDRIEVQAGQRVGIVLANVGDAPHEFSIEAVAFHLHTESGETESGTFIAPAAGQYVFGCYIPGHFEAGMKGTLVVS